MSRIAPQAVHETLRRSILVDGYPFVLDIEASRGPWLRDALTKRDYLDFYTFVASLPLGFNPAAFADPAFRERLLRAAFHNVANSDVYTSEYAEFVETFKRVAGKGMFSRYFFIGGGTLAVENALKAAFDWRVRKNLGKGRPPLGARVIHFQQAFHGRSGYSISCTSTFDPRKTQYFPKFEWPRALNPKCRFPLEGENLEAVEEAERVSLDQIRAALRAHPRDVACILLETIQGEGGDNHFRPEYLQALRRIADEEEVLLVLDEVQSGGGLTGRFWAFEHHGVVPDLVAFGKKTQVCGMAATRRIDEVENVFQIPSRINSTWGGSLADMVRCQRILETIEAEDLLRNAERVGARLLAGLADLSKRFPMADNFRGKGLLCAFDLPSPSERDRFKAAALERLLVIPGCGERTIRIRPPLNLTPDEADEGLRRIADTLKGMYG